MKQGKVRLINGFKRPHLPVNQSSLSNHLHCTFSFDLLYVLFGIRYLILCMSNQGREISIQRGAINKEGRVGCSYFDIQFKPDTVEPELLIFQNFYVASLILSQENGNILLKRDLMENPFNEEGSQSWSTINMSEFISTFNKSRPLRFTLIQPAACWVNYDLNHLKAFSSLSSESKTFDLLVPDIKLSLYKTIQDDHQHILAAAQEQAKKDYQEHHYILNDPTRRAKRKDRKKDLRRNSFLMTKINKDNSENIGVT